MNIFKFEIGDLLKVGGNIESFISPANPSKEYRDNLRVVFRFWDGKNNVYVVTAEDGIGLILIEDDAELQEASVDKEESVVDKEEAPIDGRDKHLYRIINKIGTFYVVARSFDEAADEMKDRLRKADYGFFQDRNVPSIDHLAVQHFYDDKQSFSDSEANLIIVE